MNQKEPKPVLPELKSELVRMAAAQADGTRAAQGGRGKLGARIGQAANRLSRPHLRRRVALGGAVIGVAAALLIVLGGGGSSVRTERADAAVLDRVIALAPHLQLAGGWQITSTEVSPTAGRIQFLDEHEPHLFSTQEAEIQWHSESIEERGDQLESEGFTFAGPKRMDILRPSALFDDESDRYEDVKLARVYVSREAGQTGVRAAGLWREDGRTLEYRATVLSFQELEWLMERIELLTDEEWSVALQPGGGKWLGETAGGLVKKDVKVKVGESPDGQPIYREHTLLGGGAAGGKPDFRAPLPTVYLEGDKIRVVTAQPPEGLE